MGPIIIKSLEQALDITQKKLKDLGNPGMAFIGQRASDFLLFKNLIDLKLIISLDFGKDAELIEKTIPIISLERETGIRKNCYSGEIKEVLKNSKLVKAIKDNLPPKSLIIPYASDLALETFAKKSGFVTLAPNSELKVFLGNKFNLLNIKSKLNLPNPSVVLEKLSEPTYNDLSKRLGERFVVQIENGSSGSGTFFIQERNDLTKLKNKLIGLESKFIVTPFIDGPTVSINGVITSRQIIFLPPSYQVIGNPETALKPTIFSGIDFSAASKLSQKKSILIIAMKTAQFMKDRGFLGAFNLNLMENSLVLTDINPRFMGSGSFCTQLQLENGEISLSLIHLMAFLGIDFKIDTEELKKISKPKKGSLIVLHNLENLNKTVTGDEALGIYKTTEAKIKFQRKSFEINGLKDDEALITGAVPQPGKIIEASAPLLRIFTRGSVLEPQTLKLNSKFKEVCREVYQKLNLS